MKSTSNNRTPNCGDKDDYIKSELVEAAIDNAGESNGTGIVGVSSTTSLLFTLFIILISSYVMFKPSD